MPSALDSKPLRAFSPVMAGVRIQYLGSNIMKYLTKIILIFSISLSVYASNELQSDIVKSTVIANNIAKATLSKDYDYVINQTHPKIIKNMGGRKKSIEAFHATFESNRFEITEFSVDTPTQVIRSKNKIFVIIPTKISMRVSNVIATGKGYFLSISEDKGKNWFFIDGMGFKKDPSLMLKLFPDLPSELKLPQIPPPTIKKL